MRTITQIRQVQDAVEAALALLADRPGLPPGTGLADPLPSLLDQCRALIAAGPAPLRMRTVHHFACTGGTLIAKCLGALPNTVLLSEIDPLSTLVIPQDRAVFAPTDLLLNMRQTTRALPEDLLVEVFVAGVTRLAEALAERGQHLVLRDHAHSHYCTPRDPASRPGLHAMLAGHVPVCALVTVRDPVDSYIALLGNGWHSHMGPDSGPDAYARRYRLFLDDHRDLPVLRYEDFAADPAAALERMCTALDLPPGPDALALFPMMRLSGDSGRKGDRIAPRPRKPVAAAVLERMRASEDFMALRAAMGYDDAL